MPQDRNESSLGKALRLLAAVGEARDASGVSMAELIAATKLSRPTAYRLIGELQRSGFVSAIPREASWTVGPKIIAMAAMASSSASMRRRAKEAMDEFVGKHGYTVHLGIRDGSDVIYIDKSENSDYMTISSAIGQRRTVNVTALGKCLVAFDSNPKLAEAIAEDGLPGRTPHSITTSKAWLAAIEETRAAGIATDMEECDVGARCLAAPILDANGYAMAAVSVSTLINGHPERDLESLRQPLKRLAEQIGFR